MENPRLIFDWESSDSTILINPCYSAEEKFRFEKILQVADEWPGHVWLATSGSTASKWVGLSKPAVLSSALAVNEHLTSSEKDKWVHVLPDFHVGGMGIWARSYLSGADVLDYKKDHPGKWHASPFVQYVEEKKGTLTALVPTQLFDIVHAGLKSPKSLRAVIIGGGRLDPELYRQAVALGWKVLPSYGLTECASQVATAELGSWERNEQPKLKLLSHLKAKEVEGRLAFSGQSVLSLYAFVQDDEIMLYDPKKEGWFISEDRGSCQNRYLTMMGRLDSLIKVGGESVDLDQLESHLQTLRLQLGMKEEMTLVAFHDERLGFVIHLAVEESGQDNLQPLLEAFNHSVLPFERIRHIHYLSDIPKNHLSKIKRKELLERIKGFKVE